MLFLLNKTNDDWWHVRKGSGKDGFVPANYVKEIEGKRIPVQVRQPFTVKDVRRVKKTRMVKKTVPVRKPKPPPKNIGNLKSILKFFIHYFKLLYFFSVTEVESVAQRKKNINDSYNEVVRLAKVKFFTVHFLKSKTFKIIAFFNECF